MGDSEGICQYGEEYLPKVTRERERERERLVIEESEEYLEHSR